MNPDDFNTAHEEVIKLVKTFADSHAKYMAQDYNEQQARKDFIDKFFIALGWDVNHDTQTNPYEQEVKVERSVSVAARVKKADYAFFLKPNFGQERFFVEAKRPSAVLDTPDNCFQTIRYAFSSAKAALSILTNFDELYVIDCRFRPDIGSATNHIHKKFHFKDFEDREKFGEVYYLFGREAVESGSLEKYSENLPKPKGKAVMRRLSGDNYQEIDDAFLVLLEGYREELAKMFKRKNASLDSDSLTEAVQRTIDRLVFIRFLEDKLIEPSTILDKFGDEPHPWKKFIAKSREFDKTYNGIIFKQHPVIDREDFVVDDRVFVDITDSLADKYSPYHFNYIPIHILGSIYERFLGSVIVATAKRATVEQKPEVRKAGGVFYTPQYIVKYIVENTIGALLNGSPPYEGGVDAVSADGVVLSRGAGSSSVDNNVENHPTAKAAPLLRKEGSFMMKPADVAKMRFADIACGSGSFLLGAYEYLLAWHTKYYNERATKTESRAAGCITNDDGTFALSFEQKKEILVNNIYGVDIDRQAYEVTQLSLFLKLLEDETQGTKQQFLTGHRETMLPSLNKNIICGNALVDWDITGGDLFEQIDNDKQIKLNPMSFEQKFPDIMRAGGFDAVIGNPPYVRQEQLGDLKVYLKKKYKVFHGVADLYTYFLERYFQILHPDGVFGIIVANGWMRSRFGAPLRHFLSKKDLLEIIDFGDLPVFKGVAAYPCIVRASNSPAYDTFLVTKVHDLTFDGLNLDTYVKKNQYSVSKDQPNDHGWSLSQNVVKYLLGDLVKKGVALGKYVNNQIYYGIKTGFNEAFIIDSETRDSLIAEDISSQDIIKPFLFGRDIKRYVRPSLGKYIIFTRRGIDLKKFPAIERHLLKYEGRLTPKPDNWKGKEWKGRKAGSYKWYEIQDAVDYFEKFEQPKIIYSEIAVKGQFHLDTDGYYCETTAFFISSEDKYLVGVLNSKVTVFIMNLLGAKIRGDYIRWKSIYMRELPIPNIDHTNADEKAMHDLIVRSVELIMEAKPKLAAAASDRDRDHWQGRCDFLEKTIDDAVYKLYDLTPDEIALVEKG